MQFWSLAYNFPKSFPWDSAADPRLIIMEAGTADEARRLIEGTLAPDESVYETKAVDVFDNQTAAVEAFQARMEASEEYCDNWRFAFRDDPDQMAQYDRQVREGCCGSTDDIILVGGRLASIGCNYGH